MKDPIPETQWILVSWLDMNHLQDKGKKNWGWCPSTDLDNSVFSPDEINKKKSMKILAFNSSSNNSNYSASTIWQWDYTPGEISRHFIIMPQSH